MGKKENTGEHLRKIEEMRRSVANIDKYLQLIRLKSFEDYPEDIFDADKFIREIIQDAISQNSRREEIGFKILLFLPGLIPKLLCEMGRVHEAEEYKKQKHLPTREQIELALLHVCAKSKRLKNLLISTFNRTPTINLFNIYSKRESTATLFDELTSSTIKESLEIIFNLYDLKNIIYTYKARSGDYASVGVLLQSLRTNIMFADEKYELYSISKYARLRKGAHDQFASRVAAFYSPAVKKAIERWKEGDSTPIPEMTHELCAEFFTVSNFIAELPFIARNSLKKRYSTYLKKPNSNELDTFTQEEKKLILKTCEQELVGVMERHLQALLEIAIAEDEHTRSFHKKCEYLFKNKNGHWEWSIADGKGLTIDEIANLAPYFPD